MDKNNYELNKIREEIINDIDNIEFTKQGYMPLYSVSHKSKIIIIGQAPGIKAQEAQLPWNDLSGNKLREWLGVSVEEFYDNNIFAHIPMDFYYPGKGKSGDLPPRKDFAKKWHSKIFKNIEEIKLIILIGSYSQKYYLKETFKKNLTDTVKAYNEYLPKYFPLAHPSPLNIRWFIQNPWYLEEVIPSLREIVHNIISDNKK